jgi:hypothetical protein
MNVKQTGRLVAVLAAVCGAGTGAGAGLADATTVTQTVAWGTTSSAPAGARGELFGVAAASSGDALAVGGDNPGKPPTQVLTRPYAEHWSGAGWTATHVPLGQVYPSPEQAAQLNGVTEVAPADGWAVGTVLDTSSLASRTLAYHWDGTAWTRSPTPDPAGPARPNQLNAVAARATGDVWAVGSEGYPAAPLVLHWNGSAWRRVNVPGIGGALDTVTVSAGRVWIAGGDQVAQFGGSTWTELPAPPVPAQDSLGITGLARTAAGLWAVGNLDFSCGEGGTCTGSYAARWNGTAWTMVPAGGGDGLSGVVAAGSQVLATSQDEVWRLGLTRASAQVTPAIDPLVLSAVAADPAGQPWAAGWTAARGKVKPAIINAPGIGQGGIIVTTGASAATVTWSGPVTGAGSADLSGRFAVGGLPDGSYTVTASVPGCPPHTTTAEVSSGLATAVKAHITCPS